MERLIQFFIFAIINLVAAAIAISLAQGHPISSMVSWKSFVLLVILAMALSLLFGGLHALIAGNHTKQEALKWAAFCTLMTVMVMVVFGTIGLNWLHQLRVLMEHGGVWWPVVILVATVVEIALVAASTPRPARR